MSKNNEVFAIDDKGSASDNLAAFAKVLQAMDEPLGSALNLHLASLASGQPPDAGAIWDALYAATAPGDLDPAPANGGAEGVQGATL